MESNREKITLQDTGMTAISKLACGNIGAVTALVTASAMYPSVDPQGDCILMLCRLDDLDIVGPRIWMLYKDVCKQSTIDLIGVMRAYQLGFISTTQLNTAIENYGEGLNVSEVMAKVRTQLTDFTKETDDNELCRKIEESQAPKEKKGA